jgi:hypothetical protein
MGLLPDNLALRAGVGLATTTAAVGGMYEMGEYAGDQLRDQNAAIEACAAQLGQHATLATTIPDACEQFRTSFTYRDMVVHVRAPDQSGSAEASSRHAQGFDLPTADAFTESMLAWTNRHWGGGEVSLKAAGVIVGILGILTTLVSMEEYRRREEGADQLSAAA